MERWEWEKSALWCSTSLRNIPLYKRAILVGKTWQNHHKPWDLCVPHLQIELRFPPPPAARERFSATTNPPKTHQIHWFQPAFCVLGVLGMLKTLISTCILLRLSFFSVQNPSFLHQKHAKSSRYCHLVWKTYRWRLLRLAVLSATLWIMLNKSQVHISICSKQINR